MNFDIIANMLGYSKFHLNRGDKTIKINEKIAALKTCKSYVENIA